MDGASIHHGFFLIVCGVGVCRGCGSCIWQAPSALLGLAWEGSCGSWFAGRKGGWLALCVVTITDMSQTETVCAGSCFTVRLKKGRRGRRGRQRRGDTDKGEKEGWRERQGGRDRGGVGVVVVVGSRCWPSNQTPLPLPHLFCAGANVCGGGGTANY